MSSTTPWSIDESLVALQAGGVVRAAAIREALTLRRIADGDHISQEIRFVGCQLGSLDIACLQFSRPVSFEDCAFGELMGFAAYFLAGLRFDVVRFDVPPRIEATNGTLDADD